VTLQRRLALFLLVAAIAPVVLVGFVMIRRTEDALGRAAAAEEQARAEAAGGGIDTDVEGADGALGALVGTWRIEQLGEEELKRLLFVLLQQLGQVDAAAFVDGAGSVRALLSAGAADTSAFLAGIRSVAPEGDASVYVAFSEPDGASRLAAVRRVPAAAGRDWRVAVRLRAEGFRRRLDPAVPTGGAAWVTSRTALFVGSTGAVALDEVTREELRSRVDPGQAGTFVGTRHVVAWAPLRALPGWVVLVTVPVEAAFAQVAAMRRTVLLAVLVVGAGVLALSVLLARRTTAGIARIDSAARALGTGELSVRLPVEGRDEIAAVSTTFNAMADELSRSRARLERWNEELRAEVEARTAELRAAQAQLVEAQKLAAIGQLGAGVAHEINNPLTGILGHAQLLLEEWPLGDAKREPVEKIEQLARRCRDVTQKLLRFSQQRIEPDLQPIDLNRVVADALTLAEGQIRAAGIALEVDAAEPAPWVRGDAGHLAHVVLNLLSNARTACLGLEGRRIAVSTQVAGREARLAVRDDGKGIAPEVMPRIFEPFFTTKDLWSNVGLGLSVTYRIVAEHGGRIDVESRPGQGSAFTVVLPVVAPPAV
jgi:signal transduction histidine kinase